MEINNLTSNERRKMKRLEKRIRKRKEKRERELGKYDSIEEVLHPDKLYDSFFRCQKNVNWKASVQNCHSDLLFRIDDILKKYQNQESLRHGFVCFILVERGKLRHISSVHINERMIQNSLCNNVLIPICFHSITYNNSASVKRAGIRRSEEQLKKALRQYYRKNGTNEGCIVLFDVKGYFDNIRHDIIKQIISKYVSDKNVRELFNDFTDAFNEIHDDEHQGKGEGLGSQVSQISGVMMLNENDHFLQEQASDYVFSPQRYMDDSCCCTRTYDDAKFIIHIQEEKYKELELSLNKSKTVIRPLAGPFVWLKKKYFLKEKGRVRVVLTGDAAKRERKNLRKYKHWLDEGKAKERDVKKLVYIMEKKQFVL